MNHADSTTTWHELAQQLRSDSIRATTAAGSGHPTSSMSAADLVAVLFAKYLHYDFEQPTHSNNDHFILSKGHAAPLLYALYKAAGVISEQELLSLRQFGSRLQGHPVPVLPWVEVATGSLGQGLPLAVGIALAGKYLDRLPYRTWVLLGDSEMAEGSVWESFEHASHSQLDNLSAIIDVNRLGQRGETMLGWNIQAYGERARAFGWHAIEIDGHNLEEIDRAYMVAAAVGLQVRNYKPFASTFAAFLSRAYDFVRMAAISRANIKLAGSHAGVSIGQDGPSQMALEDLAAFRAVWNSTVLYPCDGNQTAKLMAEMVEREGIIYLRTTRESTPVLYGADEEFPIGGSKVIRASEQDRATVIGAGITLHEALKAYERLKKEGITVRVIDAYSVKPLDVQTLHQAAHDTEGNLVVVEDHWLEGGLGAAVQDAFAGIGAAPTYGRASLAVSKLAVREMPGSGTPEELLHAASIDAEAIVEAVRALIKQAAWIPTE